MMLDKCPGQDKRNLKSEILKCPSCGYKIEIFSDEIEVKCPECKALACRERLPSCVDWCQAARKCIGEEKYKHLKGED